VRAVIVQMEHPFFGQVRHPQLVLRAGEPIDGKQLQLTVPLGHPDVDYSITWQLEGDRRITAKRRDSSGLVFVDEMP
jgi:hypothetical protein